MNTGFPLPAEILTEKSGRIRSHLYVIRTHAVVGRDELNAHRSAHLDYLADLDQRGLLVGAGPMLSDDGAHYEGHGMIILAAETVEQATALAAADPFHENGIRQFTVTPWLLSEGAILEAIK